jgi:hypothetical protein
MAAEDRGAGGCAMAEDAAPMLGPRLSFSQPKPGRRPSSSHLPGSAWEVRPGRSCGAWEKQKLS